MIVHMCLATSQPIPEAARSKAWVCGLSPAEIAGSNLSGVMDVCCECCVLSGRGLCDGLITRLEELSGRGLCDGLITRLEDSYRLWCV